MFTSLFPFSLEVIAWTVDFATTLIILHIVYKDVVATAVILSNQVLTPTKIAEGLNLYQTIMSHVFKQCRDTNHFKRRSTVRDENSYYYHLCQKGFQLNQNYEVNYNKLGEQIFAVK